MSDRFLPGVPVVRGSEWQIMTWWTTFEPVNWQARYGSLLVGVGKRPPRNERVYASSAGWWVRVV